MKMTAPQSMKFLKLKRRLALPHYVVVGLLESLWLFTQVNAAHGDIGRHSDEDIAAGLEWEGDHSKLIQDLVDCGWVDRCPANRLLIHDWEDHVPTYLKGALAKNGQHFAKHGEKASRLPAKSHRKLPEPVQQPAKQPAKQPAETPEQPAPSLALPSLALPNQTLSEPKPEEKPASEIVVKPRSKIGEHLLFARFWEAYPKKVSRPAASAAFDEHDPNELMLTALLAAIDRQKLSREWLDENGRYIPKPAKWLNEARWDDQLPEAIPPPKPRVYDRMD